MSVGEAISTFPRKDLSMKRITVKMQKAEYRGKPYEQDVSRIKVWSSVWSDDAGKFVWAIIM